jgi:hypothetical protein
MKNGILLSSLVMFIIGLSGCVMNRLDETHKTIALRQEIQGNPISVDVVKGKQWSVRMQAGPFVFNVLPQIVIWAEDQEGKLIDTLYITGADGKKMRHAAKNEKGAAFYPECFPVWAEKAKAAGKKMPSKKEPYTDTVTSATPMSSFTLDTRLGDTANSFFVYLEINKSDDKSEVFTKENNDWAGQPSLIYKAEVTEKGKEYAMTLVGHGGKISDEPKIYEDMTGIDTALEQIEKIMVKF